MLEFTRFVVTGLTATAGNLFAVWVARPQLSYQSALIVGLAVGFSISFLMGKMFAFRSKSWRRAPSEAARFIVVYVLGATLNWGVAIVAGIVILPLVMTRPMAELIGVLVGASVMVVTSYLGHRYYTYRALRTS